MGLSDTKINALGANSHLSYVSPNHKLMLKRYRPKAFCFVHTIII